MQPPEFFERLRIRAMEFHHVASVRVRWFGSASEIKPDFPDGLVPRLDELMTQAVLGADISITPGASARLVWVPLLVEYGRALGSSKLRAESEHDPTRSDEIGNITDQRGAPVMLIIDLHGLVVDYIEHLITRALAESLPPVERQKGSHETRLFPSALARNLDRLRLECGWTYDELATAVRAGRSTVISHILRGATPHPGTLSEYAAAFTEKLQRPISIVDLTQMRTEPDLKPH